MFKPILVIFLIIGCAKIKNKFKISTFKDLTATQKLLIVLINKNLETKVRPILEYNHNIIDEELISSIKYRELNEGLVKLILNFIDIKYINMLDKNGENLIHAISFKNYKKELKSLFKKFEQKLDIDYRNIRCESALIIASQRGNIEVVKILIEKGANLDIQDNVNYTALHWAIYNKYDLVKEFLISHGANLMLKYKIMME